jgi:MarR family transcriptional regulator, organic hydroperoxide resistance regulator
MDESRFLFWLGRIRKALRCAFEGRAASLEITAAQFLVLRRLWQGDGILTSVLMREVASDGGTITGLLDRLESKGLIRREHDRADRRARRVFLTPAGQALKEPLLGILSALEEDALAGFSPEERSALIRALERVGENLGA